jgi:hypothetical protein
MSNLSPKLPETLAQAELFQRMLIDPMLRGMQEKLDAHHAEITSSLALVATTLQLHEGRLGKLEKNQGKALAGFALYATGLSVGISYFWTRLKSYFRIS